MTKVKLASTFAIAILAIMLLVPVQGILRTAAADQNSDGPGTIPDPANCKLATQPADAISQTTTTVLIGAFTKHAEKELFNCTESGTGDAFSYDVTLYQTICCSGPSE